MSTVNGGWDGPAIVKDGLVLYLDAGSPNSFYSPTAGTTWKDISGLANNGTLTNGPTYNSANDGSIVFDGIDDFIDCGNNININTNSFSVEIILKFIGTGVYQIITKRSTTDGANTNKDFDGFGVFCNTGKLGASLRHTATNNIDYLVTTTATYNTGNFVILTAVYNRASTLDLYINGSFNSNTSISTLNGVNINTTQNMQLARRLCNNKTPDLYFPGNIANCKYYNRALTTSEINQNFQATRARFGI